VILLNTTFLTSAPSETVTPLPTEAANPASAASPSSETAVTPATSATTPKVTRRGGSLWLLILFGVLVIILAALTPFLVRWRKRKMLERTDTPNLSLTHEVSPDRDKPELRKVA
jgi:hypothetical protein